jgi:hypothetical protein
MFNQPYWVGYNNPRFPYARNGYIPALEQGEPDKVELDPGDVYQAMQEKLNQMESRFINLQNKVNKLTDKPGEVGKKDFFEAN